MSETNAQEPTMEEILASIRRIISEDDVPAAAAPVEVHEPPPAAAAPTPPPPPPAPRPVVQAPPSPPEEDVLELTDPIDAPRHAQPPSAPARTETLGGPGVFPSQPSPPPHPPAAPAFPEEPLIGSYAAEQSAGHFGALARSLAMPKEGRTLEDVVREMLRPMLRDWLDTNLPAIVEARVQAEVERISRRQEF